MSRAPAIGRDVPSERPDVPAVDVLLVDGDPAQAELTLRELQSSHHLANRVRWAKDDAQALDLLSRGDAAERARPKVVLLEPRTPPINGANLLSALATQGRTTAIAVIVLSDRLDDPLVAATLRQGARAFIPKPLLFETFAEVVSGLGFDWLAVERPSLT